MSTLTVFTTLTKPCKSKAPTTWQVGQLSTGQFAAKGPLVNGSPRKRVFPDHTTMQAFIAKYVIRYGFDCTHSSSMRQALGRT